MLIRERSGRIWIQEASNSLTFGARHAYPVRSSALGAGPLYAALDSRNANKNYLSHCNIMTFVFSGG